MIEQVLNKESKEFKNLEKLACILNRVVKGYQFFVSETWLDYSQEWAWTTIIGHDTWKNETFDIQCLSPREWKEAIVLEEQEMNEWVGKYLKTKFIGRVDEPEKFPG